MTKIARIAVRYALAAAFLSAVADRLGLWGSVGAAHVDWGSPDRFAAAVGHLNPWLPKLVMPAVAWGVTLIEIVLALLLILGRGGPITALASAALLALFGAAMALFLGIKAPLNYSVFTASAAALLLAAIETASNRRRITAQGEGSESPHSCGKP